MKREYHTYKEWQELGYQVQRGEKGFRVAGEVVFSKEQVKRKEHNIVSANWDLNGDDDGFDGDYPWELFP